MRRHPLARPRCSGCSARCGRPPTPEQVAQCAKSPGPAGRRLKELGWVEGENLRTEAFYAAGDDRRLPELAKALVAKRPDVIWAIGPEAAVAAVNATRTIPIVYWTGYVVERGLVESLARPGRNATGVVFEEAR